MNNVKIELGNHSTQEMWCWYQFTKEFDPAPHIIVKSIIIESALQSEYLPTNNKAKDLHSPSVFYWLISDWCSATVEI